MSAGYLSNLLIKNQSNFEAEFNEVYVYVSGLASSVWQHLAQISVHVKGVNYTTNIVRYIILIPFYDNLCYTYECFKVGFFSKKHSFK